MVEFRSSLSGFHTHSICTTTGANIARGAISGTNLNELVLAPGWSGGQESTMLMSRIFRGRLANFDANLFLIREVRMSTYCSNSSVFSCTL